MSEKKLFIIDAHALMYRAYYAFIKNPRINSRQENTSAPFGFTNVLLDVLRTEHPTHLIVAFDPSGPTFRHDMFPAYKAQRQETPQDLRDSMPYVKQIVAAMNVPVAEVAGFEADDVIGTLAKQAAGEGFDVFMLTPDKDYCQLVEEHIKVYRPKSFGPGYEVLGIAEVLAKFEVKDPLQVIDILGLQGDSSDNIPGAPGIGEKRAKELLAKYGSIEGVYENLHELKGKQKESLEQNKDLVMISKHLATIRLDVPVKFDAEASLLDKPNKEALTEVFNHLEFKTMLNRVLQEFQIAPTPTAAKPQQASLFDMLDEPSLFSEPDMNQLPQFKTIDTTPHDYRLVDTPEKRAQLIAQLNSLPEFCFDTETTSLDTIEAELVGLSFSWKAFEAWYVPFPVSQVETQAIIDEFKDTFLNESVGKIGQNLKYDLAILQNYNIEVRGTLFDTLIAHYLIQPELRHGLDILAEMYLKYRMVSIEELIGKKGKNQLSFRQVGVEQAKEYSGEDADVTFQLKSILEKELEEKGNKNLFTNIEMPLMRVLVGVERTGVHIDTAALNAFAAELRTDLIAIEQSIFAAAGMQFNIQSPKQLGEVLFDHLKISDKAKKTKTDQYATGEEILVQLKGEHPIVDQILEYRQLMKLLTTYVDSLPNLIHPKTGRIHTSFNQTVVATGRLSSSNPNLQNIPVRSDKGKEIRRAFTVPGDDKIFMSADYSQIELRLIAHFSNDPHFIQAFLSGEDIHAATASKIFGVPLNEVTSEQRRRAKSANFAISYGSSAFGLAQNLGIARKEAQFLIDGYFSSYPGVKDFIANQIELARGQGFVETMMGRRRYLPDINSRNANERGWAERNAVNAPIQGSAADIIKIAMIRIENEIGLLKLNSRMTMQVHDELTFEVWTSEKEMMKKIIEDCMQNAVKLQVPLLVEAGVGRNWLEAH